MGGIVARPSDENVHNCCGQGASRLLSLIRRRSDSKQLLVANGDVRLEGRADARDGDADRPASGEERNAMARHTRRQILTAAHLVPDCNYYRILTDSAAAGQIARALTSSP